LTTVVTPGTVRLATRSSPLARLQADLVADALRRTHPELTIEIVTADTIGDRTQDVALHEIGTRGLFTNEIDALVASGWAELAVHSAKDLPSSDEDGALVLAAVLVRGEVRDALVGGRLSELPPGAIVATGAPRRRVQLAAIRPDLGFAPLRGNIATRIEKTPVGGAAVVALAALVRLGLADRASDVLSVAECLPQVGQGVIAVRCAAARAEVRALLGAIDHAPTHRALDAERAFLRRLGGGCDAPVGAYATANGPDGTIHLEAMIASGDGHVVLRRRLDGADPDELGIALAESMLFGDGASQLVEAEA
jgi:hydroxymethylbilane synthase